VGGIGVLAKAGVRAWRNSWLFKKAGTGVSRVFGRGEGRGVGLRTGRRRISGVPGKCSSSLESGKADGKIQCQFLALWGAIEQPCCW
jgi:hypothetical protein